MYLYLYDGKTKKFIKEIQPPIDHKRTIAIKKTVFASRPTNATAKKPPKGSAWFVRGKWTTIEPKTKAKKTAKGKPNGGAFKKEDPTNGKK